MSEPKEILISLGSCYGQRSNIEYAKHQLCTILNEGEVFSKDLWTTPIGIDSDMFLNCLCKATTAHSLHQIEKALKSIEKKCGRSLKNDRLGHINLDLDILSYDGTRYHNGDWDREYVAELLDDIHAKEKEKNGTEDVEEDGEKM